jgi:hypothetical protein
MRRIRRVNVYIHTFLTSALDEGVVSFTFRALYSRERAPATHWVGGSVGPRAVQDAVVGRKISSPHRKSNPRTELSRLLFYIYPKYYY